ncbi:uncharacterized protein BCR38DRAFT_473953 [Pseudomassariella vexata]|uniref:EamA domain-containing protein n=1 Tax=Pseudomassariella vexata TaxID=1141098 RepID=A0A1Y2E0B1_9PEZI|nr:uncharacterized protein BCR38DRAFT_473953 [Pseudomassariella vexata]ORY64961.1 hypothetical protein BCR38DRAFT_473953 [Pseudomassariella vexata]
MARSKTIQQTPRDGFLPEHSSSTGPNPSATAHPTELRKRLVTKSAVQLREKMDEYRPSLDDSQERLVADEEDEAARGPASWMSRNQWVVFAIASGACAAFNGVFAKLTTNDLTSHLSQGLASTFGLVAFESAIEFIVRCIFFGLNLAFNGVMWTLFTKALARGYSTTQVSIMNTSTNFMVTALLGFMIFSESLPPLWWLGAAMLVAGNVVIGRKDEGSRSAADDEEDAISVAESGASVRSYSAVPIPQVDGMLPVEKDDDADEDVAFIGDVVMEPEDR